MKRVFLLPVILLAAVLCACAPFARAPLTLFDTAFEAEIEGESGGVAFSGKLSLSEVSESGVRTATFTFYAPSALAGTCVTRDEAGNVYLKAGEVQVSAPSAYATLLDLFSFGEVARVARSEEGLCVTGEDFSLSLTADGTPLSLVRGEINVRVLSFAGK